MKINTNSAAVLLTSSGSALVLKTSYGSAATYVVALAHLRLLVNCTIIKQLLSSFHT